MIGISKAGHDELMTISKGIELAEDLRLPKVIMKSDCALLFATLMAIRRTYFL